MIIIGSRRPAPAKAKASARSTVAAGKSWEVFWTTAGLTYYYDHRSGISQWQCPPELESEGSEGPKVPKERATTRAKKLTIEEKQQLLTESQLLPLDPLTAVLWGGDADEAYEGMLQHLFPRPTGILNHADRKEARMAVGLRGLLPSTVATVRRREALMKARAKVRLGYGRAKKAGKEARRTRVPAKRRSSTIVGGYSSDSGDD